MALTLTSTPILRSLTLGVIAILSFGLLAHSQIENVNDINLVATPVPGSGHDYIKMFQETVNPANGSVSLRIEAPVPKQRGDVNYPYYAFSYDSSGVSSPTGNIYWAGANGAVSPNMITSWTDSSMIGGNQPSAPGLIPGAFVANAAVGQLFFQAVDLFTQLSNNPVYTATCNYVAGFVFIDPHGTRHNFGLQWITQSGNGGSNDGGCQVYNVNSYPNGGDSQYGAEITGQQDTPSYKTYWTDAHGRGQGIEDTNGNCCGASGQTTIVNKQITSVSLPGLANPYYFTYETTPRNYQPNSVVLDASPGTGCTLLPRENVQKTVVQSVTLPNNTVSNPQKYTFGYDPTYGLLNQITYPTGAAVSYVWAVNPMSESLGLGPRTYHCEYGHDWPYIQSRTVKFDGLHPALKQTFQYTTTWGTGSQNYLWTQKTTTVTTQDLLRSGQPSSQTVYTYFGIPVIAPIALTFEGQDPVETSIVYKDWNGSVLKTVTKNWATVIPPQLLAECTTLPNGSTSGVFYTYGTLGVISDKKEFDYGILSSSACAQGSSPPTATPTRETLTTYQTFPVTSLNTGMSDRPSSVKVYGNGTLIAETDYAYDIYPNGVTPVTAVAHDDTNFPTSYTNRGNVTQKTVKCLQTTCVNAITTYPGFDETGQLLSMVDPDGNAAGGTPSQHTTYYSWTDSWLSGDTYTSSVTPPSQQVNAYLTKLTLPPTNGIAHVQSFSYDYPSGQLTAAIDENSQPTHYRYDDYFARLTQSAYPDAGQTTVGYNDAPYNPDVSPSVTTTKVIASGVNEVSTTAFDGMGHAIQTALSTDPDGTTYTATSYDGTGRPYVVYNPTRCTTPTTNCGTEPTWGFSTYTYDALGRSTQVTEQDGSIVSTSYNNNQTTVTDEAGNQRTSQTDGLGRLTKVWEAPNASGYNYQTIYGYDAFGNLLSVNQNGSRPRTFTYDSLSRLVTATNPESGTISYSYDSNGNLLSKVAPKPGQTGASTVTTSYVYDQLNRLTQKTYAGLSTAQAQYSYDGTALTTCSVGPPAITNPTNLVGRRSAMCSNLSSSSFSYDPMGRLAVDARKNKGTAAKAYNVGYTYYQDGSLNTLTYPSGDFVTYTVGGAGRATQVVDSAGNSYAGAAKYAPQGALAAAGLYYPPPPPHGVVSSLGVSNA